MVHLTSRTKTNRQWCQHSCASRSQIHECIKAFNMIQFPCFTGENESNEGPFFYHLMVLRCLFVSDQRITISLSRPTPLKFLLFDHKYRYPPGMRQFSITAHTLHRRLYIHKLWEHHCQIFRRPCNHQLHCLPLTTLPVQGKSIHRMEY